jgi:chromatin structure-remodeling complex subunit RSC3/30
MVGKVKSTLILQLYADAGWQITQYGLPAAGVLALELLEHSQAGLQSLEHLPRSEVIQNLSRLIAYIKPLVPKEDANYILCDQARRAIQRILDQILEPAPTVESEIADISEESWLPGAQSESDFWTNLPEHPLLASSGRWRP